MAGGRKGKARGEPAGIRGPLLWSATAHLLAALSLLVLATDPAAGPFSQAVKVFLVGPAGEGRHAPARPLPGPAAGKTGNPETRPAPPGNTAAPSARTTGGRETAAVEHPRPATRVRGPVAAVTDTPAGPPGGMPLPGGSPSDVPTTDSGERFVTVAEGERGAPVLPREPETAWSGGGTGSGREGGRPEAASGGETTGAVAIAAGPAASFIGTGGAGERSRPGTGTALLRERIQSRLVYPAEAVRRGQQGEVLLRIRIDPGGVPGEIRIARSSGLRILDDAARRGVVLAAPLPSAPGWVEVPVRFRLR